MSEKLRSDMYSTNYDDIVMERVIFVDLPPVELHEGHIMGEVKIYNALHTVRNNNKNLKFILNLIIV